MKSRIGKTHGSFADLTGPRGKKPERTCKRCSVLLPIQRGGGRKTYCPPCAAERYDETVAANKLRYKRGAPTTL